MAGGCAGPGGYSCRYFSFLQPSGAWHCLALVADGLYFRGTSLEEQASGDLVGTPGPLRVVTYEIFVRR